MSDPTSSEQQILGLNFSLHRPWVDLLRRGLKVKEDPKKYKINVGTFHQKEKRRRKITLKAGT